MAESHSCAFCGKGQNQVKRLMPGPMLYICDQCVNSYSARLDGREIETETRMREDVERQVQDGFRRLVKSIDLGPLNEKYQRLVKVKFNEDEPGGPAFEDIFAEFKRGVEEVIPQDDYRSRYDLGIAYHEMDLENDALRELNSSLSHALEKRDYEVAKEIMSALLYLRFSPQKVVETIRNTFQKLG